jgi:hypothetical protein
MTAAAVLLVAAIAAVISFVHIQHLAVTHGQDRLASALLPLSIDGTVAAASLVMLRAARAGIGTPWLARFMLTLSVGATLAANVGYGLPHGLPGALISGWPAVAFIGCAEIAIGMVRRSRAVAPGHAGQEVASSAREAATLAYAASVRGSNPLSGRALERQFGISRNEVAKCAARWPRPPTGTRGRLRCWRSSREPVHRAALARNPHRPQDPPWPGPPVCRPPAVPAAPGLRRRRHLNRSRARELLPTAAAQAEAALPGLGDRLAARVAGEIGEHFEQFTTPNALQCYAGRAQVTSRSGRSEHVVARRLAYNRHLGEAAHQWAFCSLSRSAWAREFYDSKIAAGDGHHPALRKLGNRWLEILWRCLDKGVRYDEAVHTTNRLRSQLRKLAA